jgi:nicotinate-nucleotide adenylyltransferase
LKDWEPEKISKRFKACKKIMKHPAVTITNIESSLGSRFTAETIYKLQRIYPQVRFVWLMGADNLVNFHHWDKWNWIVKNVPIGVLARPGEQIKAGLSPAATRYRRFRIPPDQAFKLSTLTPPVWTLLIGPMRNVSSTELRAKGVWP